MKFCPFNITTKTILLVSVFLSSAQANTDIGLSARLQYFNYEEFDTNGISLNQETGFIPGAGFSIDHLDQSFSLDIYDGTVDYDGQLQSGTPYKTDTKQNIYKLAYRYCLPGSETANEYNYYLGLSYQLWDRDIIGSVNVNGLFETYRWWTAEAGVQSHLFRKNNSSLQLELGIIQLFNGDITVDLSDFGYGKPELSLGNELGFQAALVYTENLSNRHTLNIGMEYNYSKFGRSNSETISNGFNAITITEPDSTSNHIVFYVELLAPF